MKDMEKGHLFTGIAIMAGLVAIALSIPCAVRSYRSYDRTVSVRGLCEREVPADKVIWPIKYKVVGNDLSQVYTDIEKRNAAVVSFLTGGGIAAGEVSVSTPTISDKFAQEYGSNDRPFRYVATSTVTVCTREVEKILSLLADQKELLRSGVVPENDWDGGARFSFEALNDIKPEMIEEATRNARESAQKFANDSQSRLGKIKTASQGYFTIEDRDSNTPQVKKVRVVTNVDYYLSR